MISICTSFACFVCFTRTDQDCIYTRVAFMQLSQMSTVDHTYDTAKHIIQLFRSVAEGPAQPSLPMGRF